MRLVQRNVILVVLNEIAELSAARGNMGIVLLLIVIALYIPLAMFAVPVNIYVLPVLAAGLIVYHLAHDHHDHHPEAKG
ncbi:MAG: hypothetical protein O6931_10380 [Gammaproteobacteria bacterium]|nr:hypothetical protein [Gammaproteobacteria bacterium]